MRRLLSVGLFVGLLLSSGAPVSAAEAGPHTRPSFPPPLESYNDAHLERLTDVLPHRVRQEPFNLIATALFLAAVVHTFLANKFVRWSHVLEERHRRQHPTGPGEPASACIEARVLHFLGEVEAVFGIWVIPLFVLMALKVGWEPTLDYLNHRVGFVEPLFVVVIMTISSTKPILQLAERCLSFFARLGGGGPGAWWLAILSLGPALGSLITEPAAMTISALLLARRFYALKPRPAFAYATLGLLFVNVSVGGVLTHFAAPPVLMVAGAWGWNTPFMFVHFGWIALIGIALANGAHYFFFRSQLKALAAGTTAIVPDAKTASTPAWITCGHLVFIAWSVFNAHYPVLLLGGFLFFLAFYEVTADYQAELQLRPAILVGFFLAGLVIHGGLQQWWIAPVLGRLTELPLMFGALVLTAFNDNAAITYLSTLVPGLTEGMKHAVMAGAIAGGGLTVIANAPNPAGQSILKQYFPEGIAPLRLLFGALTPTLIVVICFLLLH